MNNHMYRYASAATLSLAVAGMLCLGTPVRAQSTPSTDNNRTPDNRSFQNDDGRRGQLTEFDEFLDGHPEIAEQLRRNPSLADNRAFVQNHPALQTFLQNNPDLRNRLQQDPNVFMRQENQFDRREDARGDGDIGRRNPGDFNRFLDNHREIGEQVRRNPSLVDNREFVRNHPALQSYLQSNPGVREQFRQDPNAFSRDENRFDRTGDGRVRDAGRDHMASFGEFLDGHERIKRDVSRDPTVVKNREYVENHRDLNQYLNAHPEVKQDWSAHPNEFVKGAQQRQFNNPAATPGTNPTGTTRPTETKPGSAAGSTGSSTNPSSATGTARPTESQPGSTGGRTSGANPSGATATPAPSPTPGQDAKKPKH